jgi:hypothetical protein
VKNWHVFNYLTYKCVLSSTHTSNDIYSRNVCNFSFSGAFYVFIFDLYVFFSGVYLRVCAAIKTIRSFNGFDLKRKILLYLAANADRLVENDISDGFSPFVSQDHYINRWRHGIRWVRDAEMQLRHLNVGWNNRYPIRCHYSVIMSQFRYRSGVVSRGGRWRKTDNL